MPLITLQKYRETFFEEGSRPHLNTLRRWVRDGKLPIERRGHRIFICTEKLSKVTGNKLLDKILKR